MEVVESPTHEQYSTDGIEVEINGEGFRLPGRDVRTQDLRRCVGLGKEGRVFRDVGGELIAIDDEDEVTLVSGDDFFIVALDVGGMPR